MVIKLGPCTWHLDGRLFSSRLFPTNVICWCTSELLLSRSALCQAAGNTNVVSPERVRSRGRCGGNFYRRFHFRVLAAVCRSQRIFSIPKTLTFDHLPAPDRRLSDVYAFLGFIRFPKPRSITLLRSIDTPLPCLCLAPLRAKTLRPAPALLLLSS